MELSVSTVGTYREYPTVPIVPPKRVIFLIYDYRPMAAYNMHCLKQCITLQGMSTQDVSCEAPHCAAPHWQDHRTADRNIYGYVTCVIWFITIGLFGCWTMMRRYDLLRLTTPDLIFIIHLFVGF